MLPSTIRPLPVALALLTVMVAGAPATADASEGEAFLSVATGYAQMPRGDQGLQFGTGLQGLATIGVSDFFALRAGAETSYMFPRGFQGTNRRARGLGLQNLFVGLRYNLDVFAYVPYVAVSMVLHQRGPVADLDRRPPPALGAKASVGLDWRFTRQWSVGGRVELHAVGSTPRQFPALATLQGVLSYHFRL